MGPMAATPGSIRMFSFSLRHTARAKALAAGALVVLAASAAGQTFPGKPLELTVPFAAGTAPDAVARALADGMAKSLGQAVVVVNKPGAGGALGYKYVQARPADGYTLVLNSNSISTVYHSGMTPFDHTAFDPVARVTLELPVLAVQTSSPLNNLKDAVAFAKAHPGDFRIGSSGAGSHMHLTSVAFFAYTAADVTQVPFPTTGHVASLMGGHIEAVVTLPGTVAANVKAGSLKVLGALASTREPVFPDVPTAKEQGFDFQSDLWRGIAVPKGTPPAVVARLEDAVRKSVTSPEFKQMGERIGYLPAFQGSAEFGKTIVAEDAVIARVMAKAGLLSK
jgi:tripartite-type tricarboxylate transporter receptor subunit TctC